MTINTGHDPIGEIHSHCIDLKNREIYLTPSEGSDHDIDNKSASTFIKNIRILENANQNDITIHMSTGGGYWSYGMGIYDSIKACKSKTTIVAYSQVESMSSIIFQAADKRILTPNCYCMYHFGSTSTDGNFLDVHNWVEFERTELLNVMLDIYTKRASKGPFFKKKYSEVTERKVKSFLRKKMREGDWYTSPQQSVEYGFADQVLSTRTKL